MVITCICENGVCLWCTMAAGGGDVAAGLLNLLNGEIAIDGSQYTC